MSESILSMVGITASIGCVLGSMLYVKHMTSQEKIMEIADKLLTEFSTNTESQKKIYTIGGIIGNGVRAGVGIGGKSGKFKMEDLFGQVISGFVGKMLPGGMQQEQQQTTNERIGLG